jgi:outer membrane protein TolC
VYDTAHTGMTEMLRAHPRLVRAHAAALTDKLAARLTDEEHEPREALRSLLKTALLPNLSVRVSYIRRPVALLVTRAGRRAARTGASFQPDVTILTCPHNPSWALRHRRSSVL